MSFARTRLTYHDLIEHLQDFLGGNATASGQRDIRRAIQSAYNELTRAREWAYLIRQRRIPLYAPYEDGTLAYDHTGGSSERLVTLSDSTFPSWAGSAQLRIGNDTHQVSSLLTSTTLQLDSNLNPGADVASGTSYTLYQTVYTLPEDFARMKEILNGETLWLTGYMNPQDWLYNDRNYSGAASPVAWTIMGDPRVRNRLALFLDSAVTADSYVDFLYHRKARELYYTGALNAEFQGTVTINGDPTATTTVAGTGTAFDSNMAGSVIRVSPNSRAPTNALGDNPFSIERTIDTVADSTSLTTTESISADFTGCAYRISDPVDIDPAMEEAFLRCIEKHLATLRRMPDLASIAAMYEDAFSTAMKLDSKFVVQRSMLDMNPNYYRTAGHIPVSWSDVE